MLVTPMDVHLELTVQDTLLNGVKRNPASPPILRSTCRPCGQEEDHRAPQLFRLNGGYDSGSLCEPVQIGGVCVADSGVVSTGMRYRFNGLVLPSQ